MQVNCKLKCSQLCGGISVDLSLLPRHFRGLTFFIPSLVRILSSVYINDFIREILYFWATQLYAKLMHLKSLLFKRYTTFSRTGIQRLCKLWQLSKYIVHIVSTVWQFFFFSFLFFSYFLFFCCLHRQLPQPQEDVFPRHATFTQLISKSVRISSQIC